MNKEIRYLAYFHNKYCFDFPEWFLVALIEIDYSYIGLNKGFTELIAKLNTNKVLRQVIRNIKSGNIKDGVLVNHFNYCIENDIDSLSDIARKYYIEYCSSVYEYRAVAKYLVKFVGASQFIKEYLNDADNEVIPTLHEVLIEVEPLALVDILIEKLSSSEDIDSKMYSAQYLIKCNRMEGLNFYFQWVVENQSAYSQVNTYETINSELGNFLNEDGIDKLVELNAITLNEKFNDVDFRSLNSGTRSSIINIASKDDISFNMVKSSVTKMIEKYSNIPNISFMNYIIDESEYKLGQKYSTNMTISETKILIKRLLSYSSEDFHEWL